MYYLIALVVIVTLLLVWGYLVVRGVLDKVKQDHRWMDWVANRKTVLLSISVPRENEKTPQAAEQMFASLHGIFQPALEFQEHLSFEIVAKSHSIFFFVQCPVHLLDFVEGQIYAQYPNVEIKPVDDYTREVDLGKDHMVGAELETTKQDVYPIKTFQNFTVDPLAGITAPLSKIQDDEQVWIQMLIRPVDDSWQERGLRLIEDVRGGKSKKKDLSIPKHIVKNLLTLSTDTVKEAMYPGSIKVGAVKPEGKETKLAGTVEGGLKGIEEKITKLGFATKIRVISVAQDIYHAQSKVSSVIGAFKQFNTLNQNGFTVKAIIADSNEMWDNYATRSFSDKGHVLNIEEIASIYHLPNVSVETPTITWTSSKKGEPPGNLPIEGLIPSSDLTALGITNFRNHDKRFGIKLKDRARHMYVIGKSGTGKSTLLENMIIDDIREGRGVVVVDPHGEMCEHVLACVPEHRVDDVIVFDPADRMHPIGFNLLEKVDDDLRGIVASGFVGIFKKIFGNSWGPRLEHILRNSVLALLEYPNATMLGIVRMLTDRRFREEVVSYVKDPVIKDFWENEFAGWDQKFAAEATSPILNKVGQFVATSTIRNIVGQPKSTFDVRKIMDEGKILIINLSRGKIGEDNSALLGAMMITKIQLAAMSRADIPAEQRTDCFMYVDEFQNFATESFATILSEARKYKLCLTVANQYIAQIQEEVRDAVFGNVGTIVAYRVGAADAVFLKHEFEPVFEETDLVNQDIYKIYTKLSIDGMTGPAFSANALPPIKSDVSYVDQIIENSRQKYTRNREEVESEVALLTDSGAQAQTAEKKPNVLQDGMINIPPIKIMPQNIINGIYYKELHTTGGVKWWEGKPVEEVIAEEEKKRQKFLAKKVEHIKNGDYEAYGKDSAKDGVSDSPVSHNVGDEKNVVERGSMPGERAANELSHYDSKVVVSQDENSPIMENNEKNVKTLTDADLNSLINLKPAKELSSNLIELESGDPTTVQAELEAPKPLNQPQMAPESPTTAYNNASGVRSSLTNDNDSNGVANGWDNSNDEPWVKPTKHEEDQG